MSKSKPKKGKQPLFVEMSDVSQQPKLNAKQNAEIRKEKEDSKIAEAVGAKRMYTFEDVFLSDTENENIAVESREIITITVICFELKSIFCKYKLITKNNFRIKKISFE